jgi:hypothetical protein
MHQVARHVPCAITTVQKRVKNVQISNNLHIHVPSHGKTHVRVES